MAANGLTKANEETKCPYCGDERSKPATRQYKCKPCGKTIYVKRTIDNPQKRLMTYEQINKAQTETDAYYAEEGEKNNIARQYALQKSLITSDFISMTNQPELNNFRTICASEPCPQCEKLNNKIFRLNQHNIQNVPIPNEQCLNALNGDYYCAIYTECVFDDQLATEDYNNVILEYRDYIDSEDSSPALKLNASPYVTSGTKEVDHEKLALIRESVKENEGTPTVSLEKRQTASRKRAAAKVAIRTNNKEIKTIFIATIVLFTVALGIYVLNSPKKTVINEQANTQQAQEISDYMKRNFGMPNYTASWYNEIESIQIHQTEKSTTIDVVTTLEERNGSVGRNLCEAVSNYWQNHKNSFTGLRIIGVGGNVTNYRYSLNGKCY